MTTKFNPVVFKPVFVQNRNVRNFLSMMDGLGLSQGEGRLGLVYGQAGLGKTRTVQQFAAMHNGIYLRMQMVWRSSELSFLQKLCSELGYQGTPITRKGPAFAYVVDRLIENTRPVFLDEIEKLENVFLEVVRDLTDLSTAPFVLIGEAKLKSLMQRAENQRIWSRTYQQLKFEKVEVGDAIIFAKEAVGLTFDAKTAAFLHQRAGGTMRELKRTLINLVQLINDRGSNEVTEEIVEIAVKTGLSG